MASSDPSTLIELINWYRGAMDVATALVVIGLPGEYRTPLKRLWKITRFLQLEGIEATISRAHISDNGRCRRRGRIGG